MSEIIVNTCNYKILYSDAVKLLTADGNQVGKGIYLCMNSEESYEQFGKFIFQSGKRGIEVELPQKSDRGVTTFSQLQRGDMFLWKICRCKEAAASPSRLNTNPPPVLSPPCRSPFPSRSIFVH